MTTPVPTLATPRLTLVPLGLTDGADYERHFIDYEVIRHLSREVPWPYPVGGAMTFIQGILPNQGLDRWTWGLHRQDNPGVIGVIDLWRAGRPEHRGFWLGRQFWGQGLMTEAVIRITDYAFDILEFEELILSNALGNGRSHNIKERTGADLIEVSPGSFVDPAYDRREIWRLTRDKWRRWKAAQELRHSETG